MGDLNEGEIEKYLAFSQHVLIGDADGGKGRRFYGWS